MVQLSVGSMIGVDLGLYLLIAGVAILAGAMAIILAIVQIVGEIRKYVKENKERGE